MPLSRRQVYRRRRIVVFSALALVLAAVIYGTTTLTAAVPATAASVTQPTIAAQPAAQLTWPDFGSGAVGAVGFDGLLGSHGDPDAAVPIASITKVITALVVLDAKPIAAGEEGPTITLHGCRRRHLLRAGGRERLGGPGLGRTRAQREAVADDHAPAVGRATTASRSPSGPTDRWTPTSRRAEVGGGPRPHEHHRRRHQRPLRRQREQPDRPRRPGEARRRRPDPHLDRRRRRAPTSRASAS